MGRVGAARSGTSYLCTFRGNGGKCGIRSFYDRNSASPLIKIELFSGREACEEAEKANTKMNEIEMQV